jgi:hypothetical protein
MTFYTSGSERMRITNSGSVGIGTTNPGAKLTVIGADGGDTIPATYGGTIKIVDYGINGPHAVGGLEFRDSNGYGSKIYTNSSTDYLGFASRLGSATWTEHMVIKQATGNVGIGTCSPSGLLQVGVANSGIYFDVSTQYTPKIKAAGTISDIQIESVGSGGNVYLTAPGATSLITLATAGSERIRVDACGSIGIGVTPCTWHTTYKKGITLASGASLFGYDGDTTISHLSANHLICANNATEIRLGTGGATNMYQNNGSFSFRTAGSGAAGSAISWCTGMYINSIGNVGIGTNCPTAKLEVKGTADGDLFIGRFHAGSAKLIYGYQYGSDGYLELRTGADSTVTKLSGYTGTPSYFLSNVAINTTTANTKFTVVDNAAPNASGNITTGAQFAASISSGYASLNVGAYDDGSTNRYGYIRSAFSDNAATASEMRFYTAATERMRISTGGIVTQPYQPAFSIANGAALTGPGTVPFKNVLFDDGSNFNTTTYRFTAPVAGRYFFSFYDNIYANVAPSPSMEFRVNGTRRGAIAYTNTKTIGYWYIMSFQQVIKLSSGDYVEVYLAVADNADYGSDYSWGNFSGFLIG